MNLRAKTKLAPLARRHPGLITLLVAVPLLLGLQLLVVRPWSVDALRAQATLEADMRALGAEIARRRADAGIVETEEPVYRRLLEAGWLEPQDRLAAADRLEELGVRHELGQLDYQFRPQRRLAPADPLMQGVTIVETEIGLDIEAVTDIDLRALLDAVQAALPGAVAVTRLEIGRRRHLEVADLLALEAGGSADLVEASATILWRSLSLDETPADGDDTASDSGEAGW